MNDPDRVSRGQIRWANLPAPSGSGPGYRRPVVVLQSDAFNRSAIGTVVVCAITRNLRLALAPGNVRLARSESGLPQASVINVSAITSLDRHDLGQCVGRLRAPTQSRVDEGLRLVLGI